MTIKELKDQFSRQKITKGDLIDQLYNSHQVLSDFATNLQGTEIQSIEITDDAVIFTTRETAYHTGGVRFYIDVRDKRITPVEAFNFGVYEQEDSEMIYQLLTPGMTIFDIGANIGWYTNHIARKYPDTKIYSFEPLPETFRQLSNNTALNGPKNVVLNNIALADERKTLTFFFSPSQTGASSSQQITAHTDVVKVDCQALPLDDYLKENTVDSLDFIKCDVEGAELFVFQGARETLVTHKPIVFTEMLRKWAAKFGYHPNDIIQLFTELGYKCYVASEGKLKAFGQVDEQTIETNFFFLHPDKLTEEHRSRML